MRLFTFILTLLVGVSVNIPPSFASANSSDEWLLVDGSGAVQAGNTGAATDDAIKAAMRSAVEQALGVMISSETLVTDSELINDKILSRVEGYVKKFEIIKKECEQDICNVNMKARVERIALADDVAALAHILPQMNYPALIVSFTQKGLSKGLQSVAVDIATVETAVAKSLAGKGYRVVNQSARDAERFRQALLLGQTAGLDAKALELAAPISQVVVAGEVLLQDNGGSPYNDKIRSYAAVISAQAFESVTGKLLTTATSEAVAPHISFAVGTQKAALKAADKLADLISSGIVKGWLDACYNEHEVMMVVENLPFENIEKFKTALTSSVFGIQKIAQRSFVRGRAEFGVGWSSCNTERLAHELHGIKFGGDKIVVSETHGNSIRISISAEK
ncbi:MAG: hypothetical protein PHN84_04105 [Desulfuromonadaceae bacterium]|nr:hypothetical protein [Desulfuromonadaceae bacterium]